MCGIKCTCISYSQNCNNAISKVTSLSWEYFLKLTYAPRGRHSSLLPKATTFVKLKQGYSWPETTIVSCDQRPQHLLSSHKLNNQVNLFISVTN